MKKLVAQKKHAFLYLLILALLTMDFSPCMAQFGKIEEEQNPVINEQNAENENPIVKTPDNELKDENVGENKKSAFPALVYDLPFSPCIVHQFLLDNIEFKSTGIFRLNRLSIAYMPERDEKGDKADYIRYLRMHTKLKKDGVEIFDKYYRLYQKNKIAARFMFASNPNQENITNSDKALEAGNYDLEFYLDDKMFSTFSFEIIVLKNEDPNAAVKQKTFIKGMWDNFGYLNWKENTTKGKQPNLEWNIFYQLTDIKDDRTYTERYCEIFKNGVYFATTGKKGNKKLLEDCWNRHDYSFYNIGQEERTDPGLIITKEQLKDANYEIRAYGYGSEGTNIFKFEVINGEIITEIRKDKPLTDTPNFIEGLDEVFWLKKQ